MADNNWIVIAPEWGYPTAAVTSPEGVALATLPTFYGVELTGNNQDGALTGALHRPDGTLSGMIAAELAAPTGFVFRERNEPEDPSVRHACLHTQEGPFSALAAASDARDAPAMSRTHVSYSIGLPPDGSGYVALSVPREGDYSLFLDEPISVAFDAGTSVEARTLRSSHCERIRWIQELRFPQAGTFHLRLASQSNERVAIVLEAGHAFSWP